MRSYVKIHRSQDFRTIVTNKRAKKHGVDPQWEICEILRVRVGSGNNLSNYEKIYNGLNQATTIKYFDANGTELDLTFYGISGSALTLTNTIYDIRPYRNHPAH